VETTAGALPRERNLADGLAGILRQCPDALVLALNGEGVAVPMPPSVPLHGQRVSDALTGPDLIAPSDFSSVIDAWDRTKERGAAFVQAQLRDGTTAEVRLFDVRSTHGCLVAVVIGTFGHHDPEAEVDRLVGSPVCRTRKDEFGVYLEVDEAAEEMYGLSGSAMVGRRSSEFVHPDDLAISVDGWMRMLLAPGCTVRSRVRQVRADGSEFWVDLMNHNRLDEAEGCVLSDVVDVSQEVNIQRELEAQHRLLRRVMEAMPSGLLHVDVDQRVVHANDHLLTILGSEPGIRGADLFDAVADDDRPVVLQALAAACDAGVDADLEVHLPTVTSGGPRVCALAVRSLIDDQGLVTGAVVSATDVTEVARRRIELELRASLDPLTHCYNRDSIMAALDLAVLAEPVSGTAVLFIDLDGFKAINDRLGHAAGDHLLCAVADRLNETVRTGDLVGRIGGDEFLVVCPHVPVAHIATTVGQRLHDALRMPIVIAGEPIEPSASIGVAWVDGIAAPADLVAAADAAMYRAKREQRAEPVLVLVGDEADPP
jgi:diguanylate cyclase (GGDEF)-like protein/PAS domain S-box-containing protein